MEQGEKGSSETQEQEGMYWVHGSAHLEKRENRTNYKSLKILYIEKIYRNTEHVTKYFTKIFLPIIFLNINIFIH